MIIEHNLRIIRRIDLSPGNIFIKLNVWIYIDDFSITLVSEQETWFTTSSIDLEVGGVVWCTYACLPIVIAEVGGFGDELDFALKDWLEVLGF